MFKRTSAETQCSQLRRVWFENGRPTFPVLVFFSFFSFFSFSFLTFPTLAIRQRFRQGSLYIDSSFGFRPCTGSDHPSPRPVFDPLRDHDSRLDHRARQTTPGIQAVAVSTRFDCLLDI